MGKGPASYPVRIVPRSDLGTSSINKTKWELHDDVDHRVNNTAPGARTSAAMAGMPAHRPSEGCTATFIQNIAFG